MAQKRKRTKYKTKTAISIDCQLLERVRNIAEKSSESGGVSGLIERCVRHALPSIIRAVNPALLTKKERIRLEIDMYDSMRDYEITCGNYSGEYEDDIADLYEKLAEESEKEARSLGGGDKAESDNN